VWGGGGGGGGGGRREGGEGGVGGGGVIVRVRVFGRFPVTRRLSVGIAFLFHSCLRIDPLCLFRRL